VREAPEIRFHAAEVEVVHRPEGYRELWCTPAHWTYANPRPIEELAAESYSAFLKAHEDPDFWSASDAACRAAGVDARDLDVRELTVLATRRAHDFNRAEPWAARSRVAAISAAWEPEASDIDPFARISKDEKTDLWSRYGMQRLSGPAGHQVVTGFDIRASARSPVDSHPWEGGPGVWYAWEAIREWDRWPRRQEAEHMACRASPGRLRLFVSHRWETPTHPDPTGRQLLALKVGLTLALAAALHPDSDPDRERSQSGLPRMIAAFLAAKKPCALRDPQLAAWASEIVEVARAETDEERFRTAATRLESGAAEPALNAVRGSIALWYDRASMYQAPRSGEQDRQFRADLMSLNAVQASAATVVLAGDGGYESRAWCFLEICGGVRGRIVELTPSWGRRVKAQSSLTGWANITDQLIGALVQHGPTAIGGAELEAEEEGDLAVIAGLAARLPLLGLVQPEGADLIGGAIPLPRREQRWVLAGPPIEDDEWRDALPLNDPGRLPDPDVLRRMAHDVAGAAHIDGLCGVWVYTSQRLLSLAWAARAAEAVRAVGELMDAPAETRVACAWADSRSLGDDGSGWCRVIPSTVQTLVVVTQEDLASVCLLYDRVVRAHVAAGATVVTYAADTGRAQVARPDEPTGVLAKSAAADVLVVRRIRRSTAYPAWLFVAPETPVADVELAAALRTHPNARVRLPTVSSQEELAALSRRRVTVEALARTIAASWERFATPDGDPSFVLDPDHPFEQLDLIEGLVRRTLAFSDNPLERRRLLYALLDGEDELYPELLDLLDELMRAIRR
jgi:hypothetical protein